MKLQNKTRHQQTKEPKCDNVHHFLLLACQHANKCDISVFVQVFSQETNFLDKCNVSANEREGENLQILHFSIQAAQLPGSGDSPKIRIPPLGTLNLMEKHLIFQSGLKSNSLTSQQSCNMAKKSQVISTFSCCSEASNPAPRHPQADHLFCALDPERLQ